MSYFAALCPSCAKKTDASLGECKSEHLEGQKRDCEWCGADFRAPCTLLEGERPKPDVCKHGV